VQVAVLADVLAGGQASQAVVRLWLDLQLGVHGPDHLGHLLAGAAGDGERRAAGVLVVHLDDQVALRDRVVLLLAFLGLRRCHGRYRLSVWSPRVGDLGP